MFAPLYIMASQVTNVPRVIIYLRHANKEDIDFLLKAWSGGDILSIIPWNGPDGPWALKVDLAPLEKPGEEGYLPFPWEKNTRPTLFQAIERVRDMKVSFIDVT
jgi:hypothetical protein